MTGLLGEKVVSVVVDGIAKMQKEKESVSVVKEKKVKHMPLVFPAKKQQNLARKAGHLS